MITGIVATVFMILGVGVVLWGFLAGERRVAHRQEILRLSGRERIECSICGHIYEDMPLTGVSQCPVCLSYHEISAKKPEKTRDEELIESGEHPDADFLKKIT